MKKILLALLMIGTLFGCATSTDETGSGPIEETNTPADYFGVHPDYRESFQLSQGESSVKLVNFYTEEEKELLNKKFPCLDVDELNSELEKYIIATSKDGKHKYDPTQIKIKNVKNVTWYNINYDNDFWDVDINLKSNIYEPFEYEYEGTDIISYDIIWYGNHYYYYDLANEEKCQELINNKSFIEDLIRKQEDIYKLKYDLKTFKVKEGFQDADFLDEEKNPYLQWINVSIPVYYKERDENTFEYKFGDNDYEYTNDESLGWDLLREDSIYDDVNKTKEAVIAGKYYNLNNLSNAKIENDEIYITHVCLQPLYYLVTLEYENLEYDVIIELRE